MQDTTTEARQKQFEIIFSKTDDERLCMGLEMMEDMRKMVMRSISLENPNISEVDGKIEFVKRYYKHDFTPSQLSAITQWFRNKE